MSPVDPPGSPGEVVLSLTSHTAAGECVERRFVRQEQGLRLLGGAVPASGDLDDMLVLVLDLLQMGRDRCLHVTTNDDTLPVVLRELHCVEPDEEPDLARWLTGSRHADEHAQEDRRYEPADALDVVTRLVVIDGRRYDFFPGPGVFLPVDDDGVHLDEVVVRATMTAAGDHLDVRVGRTRGFTELVTVAGGDFEQVSLAPGPLADAVVEFLDDWALQEAFVAHVTSASGFAAGALEFARSAFAGLGETRLEVRLTPDQVDDVLVRLIVDPRLARLHRAFADGASAEGAQLREAAALDAVDTLVGLIEPWSGSLSAPQAAWPTPEELERRSNDDELWGHYCTTHVAFADFVLRPAHDVPDTSPLQLPLHVITACAPASVPSAADAERLRLLQGDLTRRGRPWSSAVGRSPDGVHQERSVAVQGLDAAEALQLGRRYGQVAVFEWTREAWSVIASVGDRRTDQGWSVEKSEAEQVVLSDA